VGIPDAIAGFLLFRAAHGELKLFSNRSGVLHVIKDEHFEMPSVRHRAGAVSNATVAGGRAAVP